MSCHSKEKLESMLEDVVNELDLSQIAIEKHGTLGTPPAELVRLVLEQKNLEIKALKAKFASPTPDVTEAVFTREDMRACWNARNEMTEGGNVFTKDFKYADFNQFINSLNPQP